MDAIKEGMSKLEVKSKDFPEWSRDKKREKRRDIESTVYLNILCLEPKKEKKEKENGVKNYIWGDYVMI